MAAGNGAVCTTTERTNKMKDPAPAGGKTVLCVDDDPGILSALERVLRRTPFEIVTALGPEEGMKLAATLEPDLILLDIKMPGMSGTEFIQEARRFLDDVPVVFITGVGDLAEEARRLGAGYYIRKPFSNRYVRNVVEMLIGDVSDERRLELAACMEEPQGVF